MSGQPQSLPSADSLSRGPAIRFAVLAACAVWACWPLLAEMSSRWSVDPTYSHGYLVPIVAGVILWSRRGLRPSEVRPAWWGLLAVALGVLMQVLGGLLYVRWLGGASLIAYLVGATALAGGWPLLRWAWPSLAFLVFMIPLPYFLDVMMQRPLQRLSTFGSGYLLQTLGLPAVIQGNVILLDDYDLGVVDACSGLKMFIIFICISTAVALLVHRPLPDRILILLAAPPIAILCNIIRITLTGIVHEVAGKWWADLVFHDLAGWLMMPMALAMLWGGLKLLDLLLLPPRPSDRAPIRRNPRLAPIRVGSESPRKSI